MAALAKRIKPGHLRDYLSLVTEIATTGCHMRGTIAKLEAFPDAAVRLAKDAAGTLLSSLVKSSQLMQTLIEKARLKEEEEVSLKEDNVRFSDVFSPELSSETWLDMIKLQMAKASEQLQLSFVELDKVTKGYSSERHSWKENLASDALLKDILPIAEKTILTMSAQQVQSKLVVCGKDRFADKEFTLRMPYVGAGIKIYNIYIYK